MLSSCSSKGASHVNKNTSISEVAMVIVISMGVVVDMLPAAVGKCKCLHLLHISNIISCTVYTCTSQLYVHVQGVSV